MISAGTRTLARSPPRKLARPAKAGVNTVRLDGVVYRTSTLFNPAALGVMLILVALYKTFW